MIVVNLNELVEFSATSHTKSVFFEATNIKAQVMGLEAGQQIPPCRMDYDVVFVVLSGQGEIIVEGEEKAISENSFIFVPKEKETRSLKARTRMAVLAIQIRG